MGFLQNLFGFKANLTEDNRESIWRAFGSFKANQLGMQGSDLIRNSFEKNVDVYAVIKKIVDVSKSVPWIVEQKQPSGEWKTLENTPIHDLMDKPNESKGYTWNDIEEQLLTYLLITGNAYLFGERPTGMKAIAELDVLPPNNIVIKTNDSFFLTTKQYEFEISKTRRVFEQNEIGHIKFFNPGYNSVLESQYGLSLIQVAAQVVQVGNDRWDANASLFQNRGANGLITDKSPRPMTPDEAKLAQASWNEQTSGSSNFGKIKVTNKDLNYIQMGMSSIDMQLIESGVVNLRAICNVFSLDSSLFNDPANKTYNNALEAQKALYTNAIMPLSDKIAEHLTRYLCLNIFPNKKVRMRQDFSKVDCLQENLQEKSAIIGALKDKGIISASTAADMLGMPKLAEPNVTLEALSGMSPLLATQVIGQLTEDEIRALVNLGHSDKPKIGAAQVSSFVN